MILGYMCENESWVTFRHWTIKSKQNILLNKLDQWLIIIKLFHDILKIFIKCSLLYELTLLSMTNDYTITAVSLKL